MRKAFFFLFAISVCVLTISMSTTSKASSVQTVSTVTFEFDGMMGLFMGDDEKVTVGLLSAHHHSPEMAIYKLVGSERREIARYRAEQLKRTINVSVEGGSGTQRPFQYLAMEGREKDDKDFRWTLDIEGELYKRKLKIKEESFFAKVHFNSGVFYSARLNEKRLRFIGEDGKMLAFDRQASEPASKIDLSTGQAVVIEGLAQALRLSAQAGTNYLVELTNLPPQEMMNIEHFEFYYDVIDEDIPSRRLTI